MKLVVLAGAKKGAAVALKKERLLVGRSREADIRTGSDAISRRHCEFVRGEDGVTVRDLGSRNGTHVNGDKIEGDTLLSHGDEIRIGPLEFRYDSGQPKAAAESTPQKADSAAATSGGTGNGKADKSGEVGEDSISEWLLGPAEADREPASLRETQTFRMDDTQSIEAEESESEETVAESDEAADDSKAGDKKKKPGKLPKMTGPQSKDSREAASNLLRDMARRR
ncbi:Oxoglutarate dehydrogenase inhibitor [Pseudobythopirellula maris]|uniref:Oxoglutarate dehydrogenase inhibitor n=1 Tax=Pseudobythopirellula maris TaxID=2527991 RepID=A0A5C5ZGN9_9BACT|nr:FHA domain-containing protein [Pseudobythopirellula maris]TWT86275.1 Oxoglutarate dehydrogenase inhibitor [Pseudobythopirellula maris]